MTAESVSSLIAARRNDSNRRRQKVVDALDQLHASGEYITVSAVARTAGVDRSFLYRHNDLRSQILAAADQPEPLSSSGIRTSPRSLQADLANLRAHNERLRHQVAKLSERLSEVLGEQVFHDAGLTQTDEISSPRQRVAELEQQLLDRRQDLQDRDDELAAARATNRDLIATLNRRPRPRFDDMSNDVEPAAP
jgi:chromosome segregation ATPase